MTVDVVVVGASFAGLACARAAAKAGLQVVLLEKKATAGDKLHTTGIIVKDAIDSESWLSSVPLSMVRRIDGVRLYAPNLRSMDLHAPGYYFWATDASALLDWMVQDVRSVGVDVRLQSLFTQAEQEGTQWRLPMPDGAKIRTRYLVGADGPHSRVATSLGLSSNQEFLFGIEHEYVSATIEPGLLHCFIDRQLAPGYIGWALAGVRSVQIGLARRIPPQKLQSPGARQVKLDAFMTKIAPAVGVHDSQPLSVRAGMIPCGGLLPKVSRPGALLVGDAAGMVSPVTAGGIRTALLHGRQVGEGIGAFLAGRAPDPAGWLVQRYPNFRAKRTLRWMYDRFQSDWMFNQLIGTRALRRAAELVYFHRKGGVALPSDSRND